MNPMATRGRPTRMTLRDWIDVALVIVAIVVISYFVGQFVPLPT